ncbi:MAG: xylulokinase [Spirochaetales bacterium]|nr:xylulokinase [Spirochaetales bacterium]
METVLGIDLGTQSIKFFLYDYNTKKTVAVSKSELDIISKADGTSEQKTEWWIAALKDCSDQIDANLLKTVKAVGVSGQQHGFVPLNSDGKPVYNVKLWNDVSTTSECLEITERFGGKEKLVEKVGNPVLPGYTAPKVLWLKNNMPEAYKELAHILLPHDYINYFLTNEYTAEYGDASGTAFFDVRKRVWSKEVLKALDPERDLMPLLPRLIEADESAGKVSKQASEYLGIPEGVPVSAGGGDNMMGAIGTGAVKEGVMTVSLGTSGTIYAMNETPVIDPDGNLAAFCSSTGAWLPLLCTMNCTVATEKVRALFDEPVTVLGELASKVKPGSDGVIVLPYFTGERTPSLPNGRGVIAGLTPENTKEENIIRASMESAILGLRLGYESLEALGMKAAQVRLIGGGAKNPVWRSIAADVLNLEVVSPANEESAAFGAALQALWMLKGIEGAPSKISDLIEEHVSIDEESTVCPEPGNVALYNDVYDEYKEYLGLLKPKFE